jgi:hypothetical protein
MQVYFVMGQMLQILSGRCGRCSARLGYLGSEILHQLKTVVHIPLFGGFQPSVWW